MYRIEVKNTGGSAAAITALPGSAAGVQVLHKIGKMIL
jgi:hypothetical protein